MKFKDVKGIGILLEKYLTCEGYNLWHLNEAGLYNSFLKEARVRSFFEKKKYALSRFAIKRKRNQRFKRKFVDKNRGDEILMVPYDMSHVNTFSFLYKKLKGVRVIRNDGPSTDITQQRLNANNIPFANLDNFLCENVEEMVKDAEKFLNGQLKLIKSDVMIKERLGEDYGYVMDVLEYCIKTRKMFLETVCNIGLFREIYSREKYKIVLVSDDVNATGRIACLVAKEFNLPSLVIQHGQLQGNPVGEVSASFMALNGESERELLVSEGADSKKLVVTGQPRFDNIFNNKFDRITSCNELGIDSTKKVVIFTAQKPLTEGDMTRTALDCFLDTVRTIENRDKYEFVVTMREDMSLEDLPKDYKKLNLKVIIGGDIHKILACCDVFTTAFSTVAIEAVLLGKPVISVNIGFDEFVDYTGEGVGFRVQDAKYFMPRLEEVLNDREFGKKFEVARKKFVKNYNCSDDGKSTERQIELINKIMGRTI